MGENEIIFTPQGDDDVSEAEIASEKTMGQILSEVKAISDLIRRPRAAEPAQEETQAAEAAEGKSKTAALKTTAAEAVKQTGSEQVQQLKGINKKMDVIAARLEETPAGAVVQTQKGAVEKAAAEPAKEAKAQEVKEITATPAAPKTGETEKEAEGWEKFSAKNRQNAGLLKNEWTDKVDTQVSRLKSQSNAIGQTLHTVGMRGMGDSFLRLGEEGGLLDAIGARLFLPALAAYGITKIAGDSVKAIRETRNRDIDQAINAGEATEETAQNGLYDFLHKFGFSAVSGKELSEFRQSDLSQNWALFSAKGDDWFQTQKTLKTMGWDSQADQQWAQEMVAMGQSAKSVKAQFMDLSNEAKETGLSFKNLTSVVGTAAVSSDKALGETSATKIIEGSKSALHALQGAGLEGNQQTIESLENNGDFKLAAIEVMDETGHGQEAMNAENSPQILMDEVLKNNLFPQVLKQWEKIEYETAGGNEERYAANLQSQGFQLSNVQSSLTTSFAQGGGLPTAQASGSPVQNSLHVTISSTPELAAKVIQDGHYQQAIHGSWENYYQMNNFGSNSATETGK